MTKCQENQCREKDTKEQTDKESDRHDEVMFAFRNCFTNLPINITLSPHSLLVSTFR